MASDATSVASTRRDGSRATISLRIGVPWQYASPTMSADAARLRASTCSTAIVDVNPPAARSARTTSAG